MTVDVSSLLRRGEVDQAFAGLLAAVRKAPADTQARAVLVQLMMVMGDWERAARQLRVLGELDAAYLPMAQLYGAAVGCERVRGEVFAGKQSPMILGEPPEWIGAFVEALRAEAGDAGAGPARQLRDGGRERAPAIGGRLNGQPFAWLADADPRLGPTFEMIVGGRYYWVPVQRVARLRLEAPRTLRDLIWAQAAVTWETGGESAALLPVRYPGSAIEADPAVRLARVTRWVAEHADREPVGIGQRLFATDVDDVAFLEVREIEFERPTEGGVHASA